VLLINRWVQCSCVSTGSISSSSDSSSSMFPCSWHQQVLFLLPQPTHRR
jgi:hypothetical protein